MATNSFDYIYWSSWVLVNWLKSFPIIRRWLNSLIFGNRVHPFIIMHMCLKDQINLIICIQFIPLFSDLIESVASLILWFFNNINKAVDGLVGYNYNKWIFFSHAFTVRLFKISFNPIVHGSSILGCCVLIIIIVYEKEVDALPIYAKVLIVWCIEKWVSETEIQKVPMVIIFMISRCHHKWPWLCKFLNCIEKIITLLSKIRVQIISYISHLNDPSIFHKVIVSQWFKSINIFVWRSCKVYVSQDKNFLVWILLGGQEEFIRSNSIITEFIISNGISIFFILCWRRWQESCVSSWRISSHLWILFLGEIVDIFPSKGWACAVILQLTSIFIIFFSFHGVITFFRRGIPNNVYIIIIQLLRRDLNIRLRAIIIIS